MKFSKKFKLLSTLSSVVVATSLVTTSCAAISKNSNGTEVNGTDIGTFEWVKRNKYTADNSGEIVNMV